MQFFMDLLRLCCTRSPFHFEMLCSKFRRHRQITYHLHCGLCENSCLCQSSICLLLPIGYKHISHDMQVLSTRKNKISCRWGVLSTIGSGAHAGYPAGCVVEYASDVDGYLFFAFSSMSSHTSDVRKNGKASITITATGFKVILPL